MFHHEPAPLLVPRVVDAVDHLVNILNPELGEQLGRHLVNLNQVLILVIIFRLSNLEMWMSDTDKTINVRA